MKLDDLQVNAALRIIEERDTLRSVLLDLVARLDIVHNDPAYVAVWQINQAHAGPYSGPTYTAELDRARTLIAMKKPTVLRVGYNEHHLLALIDDKDQTVAFLVDAGGRK